MNICIPQYNTNVLLSERFKTDDAGCMGAIFYTQSYFIFFLDDSSWIKQVICKICVFGIKMGKEKAMIV